MSVGTRGGTLGGPRGGTRSGTGGGSRGGTRSGSRVGAIKQKQKKHFLESKKNIKINKEFHFGFLSEIVILLESLVKFC